MLNPRRYWLAATILAALGFAFVIAGTAAAQQPGEIGYRDEPLMPPGKAAQRIEALIETINDPTAAKVERFLKDNCTDQFFAVAPLAEHIDVFQNVSSEWGGCDYHGVRKYTPPREGETVVIVKDRNMEAWRAFVLTFEGEDSLIGGLNFSNARTPSNVQEEPVTAGTLKRTLEQLLQKLCTRDVFSGTVLVAKGDQIIFEHACGKASLRYNVPNNIDTKFNLGSMNKMFTGTAIAQLAEKGLVSFDAPISTWIDESWLPKDVTDKITVHHLLTHRSGLGSYFNEEYEKSSRLLFRELDDYKPLIKDDRPQFEPGAQFAYSNTGMFLLGVIIEKASGQNYFEYVREHIYKPAGMTNTDCYDVDQPVENLAMGYIPDRSSPYGWRENSFDHVIRGGPAGGGYSTVRDLHKFARALQTGKLLKPQSVELLWTDHYGDSYGYGFGVADGPAGRVVGHGGGFPGLNANLDILVDKGYVIAVMANRSRGASPLASRILSIVTSMQD